MVQDVYLALVECEKCGRRFPLVYEYPSMDVHPFGEFCHCGDSQLNIVGANVPMPEQWFKGMEAKRGVRL